jgi:MHS family proline/betaine transporter-like MFS transporter
MADWRKTVASQSTASAGDQSPFAAEVPVKLLRRAVAAAAIGNATEWYDYGVYSYVAIEIGKNFFPGSYSTAASLLVFAVSFVLRPLGGMVWGPLGDRLGRNKIMAATILLMSSATFLVGVIPNHASIGIWAPIILILLRVVQGFSTGGEYGGAATFMAEYAPDRKRGFWGSFLEFGTLTGFTAGLVITLVINTIIGDAAMTSWGWRIPFLVGLPLGAIGLYLRLRMEDSPVFRELESSGETGQQASSALRDVVATYWPALLRLFALVVALNVADYTLLTYMPTYLQTNIGLTSTSTDVLIIIGQVIMMLLLPVAGSLSDRIGRKKCWWASFIGLFVLSAPMFMLLSQSYALAVLGFAVMGLIFILQLGTISATFPAMFPAHVRYTGMALAYNIATAAFGGTASYVDNALVSATGNKLMPAYYVMAACIVGAIGLIGMPETAGCSLRGRGVPGVISRPAGRRPGTSQRSAPGVA